MEISYVDESDSSNRPENAVDRRTSNHICSKCSQTFSTNQAFLYHSRYGSSCGRFSKRYQCRKCADWKGTTFADIESHLRFVHDSDTTAENLSWIHMYLSRRDKMVSNSTQTNQPISSSNYSLLAKSSISKPQNLPKLAEWSSVQSHTTSNNEPTMPECSVQIVDIPANRCNNCNISEVSNDSVCSRCQSRLNCSTNTTENTSDVNKNDEFEHKSGQEHMFIQEMDNISH